MTEVRNVGPSTAGRFAESVVVVTGASGQVGAQCVQAFVREGARVVAVDTRALEAHEHAERVETVVCDLSHDASIDMIFDTAEARFGTVDVLVQSAAVLGHVPFLALTGSDLDRVWAVNVRALVLAGRAAAQRMIDAGIAGTIVNLSSLAADVSDGGVVGYEASKGAVSSATRSMAVALAPHGIRVNAVAPGEMVKTQEIDLVRDPHDLTAYERARIPLGRLGTGEDMAHAVLFLASEAAAYITGEVVRVDGGALAAWRASQPDRADRGDDPPATPAAWSHLVG